MDNSEEKIRNIEEWHKERGKVKPFIDTAVDYHNRARIEARYRNYQYASELYRHAIENYQEAMKQGPKYYLQDLVDRIDYVIEEYVNNLFNLKISGDSLKHEQGINDFVQFFDGLNNEEKKYIHKHDIAQTYINVSDFYYNKGMFEKAAYFYKMALDVNCGRPFVDREAYYKIAVIHFKENRFKEAVVNFVSVLSFDRENKEVISYIEQCLQRLGISQYKDRFLAAGPNDAKKLIMEVM